MGKKVLFAFAGTGDQASSVRKVIEQEKIGDEVIRVYFNGCQDSAVGGRNVFFGNISPNLEHVAAVIRNCFTKDKTLSLKMLQQLMGNAIIIEPKSAMDGEQEIDEVLLTGFSRGAVTTFATARYLNDLAIPIFLFAEDPVPGHSSTAAMEPDSQYNRNIDLSACHNLTEAEVLISHYSNKQNFILNTYGKQMAPKFGEQTNAAIFTVAKKTHNEWSYLTQNHQIDFLKRCGVYLNPGYYPYRRGSEFSIPKIGRQPFHAGVHGRTEESPMLKTNMLTILKEKGYSLTKDDSFKIGQAAFALYMHSQVIHIPLDLLKCVMQDKTNKGKEVREFIVEMNSVFLHSKQGTELTDKQEKILMYNLQSIFVLTNQFIQLTDPTVLQNEDLELSILKTVESLKNQIPDNVFKAYLELTTLLLEENTLTHPHLGKFINESETFERGLNARRAALDGVVSNAADVANKLYVNHVGQRGSVYDEHKSLLPTLIKTAEELADIGQFATPSQLGDILNVNNIRETINTADKLSQAMQQLPTYNHRKILYNAMSPYIPQMNLNLSQTFELMDYLSLDKCNDLFKRLPLKTMSCGVADLSLIYNRLSPDRQKIIVEKAADNPFVVQLMSKKSVNPAQVQQLFLEKYNNLKQQNHDQSNLNEEGKEQRKPSPTV